MPHHLHHPLGSDWGWIQSGREQEVEGGQLGLPYPDKSRAPSPGRSPTPTPASSASCRPPGSSLRSAPAELWAGFCAPPAPLWWGVSEVGGAEVAEPRVAAAAAAGGGDAAAARPGSGRRAATPPEPTPARGGPGLSPLPQRGAAGRGRGERAPPAPSRHGMPG